VRGLFQARQNGKEDKKQRRLLRVVKNLSTTADSYEEGDVHTFADVSKCRERISCNCTRSPKTRQNDSKTMTIATNLGVSEIIKVVLSNCKS
jgi:hypothetical protein